MFRSTYNRELLVGVEICKDGHKCENGGKCVEDAYNENSYHCDCDENTAGLYCSHQATEFCSLDKKHFCTNLGTCKIKVTADEPHPGCTCRDGYVGDFCQFVEGSDPENYPPKSDNSLLPMSQRTVNSTTDHSSVVTPFGFFLLIAFFTAFVVSIAILSRKVMKKADGKTNDPEFIMELEDDDDIFFDDINDYDYGLKMESEHDDLQKLPATPKQIT